MHNQSRLLQRTFVVGASSDLGQPFHPRQTKNVSLSTRSGQVRSECLTYIFRASCCSARLSRVSIYWISRSRPLGSVRFGEPCYTTIQFTLIHVCSWLDGSSDRSLMVDPLSYFSFQPVLCDLCNKGRGIYYPVCGMVHIKEPLLLIGNNSPCGGSGFPLSLSI